MFSQAACGKLWSCQDEDKAGKSIAAKVQIIVLRP